MKIGDKVMVKHIGKWVDGEIVGFAGGWFRKPLVRFTYTFNGLESTTVAKFPSRRIATETWSSS